MEIRKIEIEAISPSPLNPRKTIDEDAIEELASNIKSQGLLQPITVRPVEYYDTLDEDTGEIISVPTKYEIVCGERRYRACRKLYESKYLTQIDCIVREMNDNDAFEAMITENLQRKDVDPIEEAFAFAQLAKRGNSIEDLAIRFGKSKRFITGRIKLNNLIPELMILLKDGDMTISAAMIVCKLDDDSQRKFLEMSNYYGYSSESAKNFISNLFLTLKSSVWYKHNATGYKGACQKRCSECELNTNSHGCLFYEMNDKEARCTDREKFQKKTMSFILDQLDKQADELVKVGESIESGKTVIISHNRYSRTPEVAKILEDLRNEITAKGYAIVDDNDLGRMYFSDEDDEQTQKLLSENKIIKCLSFDDYSSIFIKTEFYYFKENDESDGKQGTSNISTIPQEVKDLTAKYKRNNEIYIEKRTAQFREKFNNLNIKEKLPLSDTENFVLYAIILDKLSYNSKQELGFDLSLPKLCDEYIRYIEQHKDDIGLIFRLFIQDILSSSDVTYNSLLKEMQLMLMKEWDKLSCDVVVEGLDEDLEKKQSKIIEKLKALGYDKDGNKL